MKISRDGFGDRFVSDCGRVFVFACVYQKSNGLTLFVIGQLIPLLFLRKLLSDVVFREAAARVWLPGRSPSTLAAVPPERAREGERRSCGLSLREKNSFGLLVPCWN